MYRNLTPHAVTVVDADNNLIHTFPPEQPCPRVACHATPFTVHEGITLTRLTFGEVQALPPAQPDTYLIVSALVQSARPDRHDLVAPADLVRDDEGRIIGCRSFSVNS